MAMTINGSGTITGLSAGGLPDATITQPELATGVAGTGPAFSAYASSGTSMTNTVITKMAYATEDFDTASCYNNTGSTVGGIPAYAFLPNVAGYYYVTAYAYMTAPIGSGTTIAAVIYKNGAAYAQQLHTTGAASYDQSGISALVYCNGTTDYIEAYFSQNSGSTKVSEITSTSKFSGFMVRSA